MLGIFNGNDQPIVEVEIKGFGGATKKLAALVDSGFNGYIQIPLIEALPLGLILTGVQENMLADGSTSSHLVCDGRVGVDGKYINTPIDIHAADIILLGTKLLKKLNKTFILNCMEGKVEIVENNPMP